MQETKRTHNPQSNEKNSQITFELPHPPTLNDYFHVNHWGALYVTTRGKKYRKEVAALIIKQTKGLLKIKTPVELVINVYPPDRRKRDLDNILKCLLDAIQDSRVIENDNQVYKLTVTKQEYILGITEVTIIY